MPEIIDGVSYETTPVIPASTNTPAGGARPFPADTSPGKALWQMLKRYAQELDKFESTVIRTLTDRVVAAESAVSATSPQSRMFGKVSGQAVTGGATNVPLTLVADSAAGDPGQPADASKGISLSADGTSVTVGLAGLYATSFYSYIGSQYFYKVRMGSVDRSHYQAISGGAGYLTTTSFVKLPAGAVIRALVDPQSSGNIPADIRFSVIRLGA